MASDDGPAPTVPDATSPRLQPPSPMDKEEFERLKAEEKAHLRQLRALKQTHREAQRKASSINALNAMRNRALEEETDALTEGLLRDAALQDARLDLALEGRAPQTGNADDLDREALAKAEAEALVRQMKAAMGGDAPAPSASPTPSASSALPAGKTIGRTPPPADAPPEADPRSAKTIGRPRTP